MGYSPPILRSIRLFIHRRARFIPNSLGPPNDSCYHPQSRNDGFPRKSTLPTRSWIVSHTYLCVLRPLQSLTLIFAFSEGEALRVLADLHGGGDRSNEDVLLEYEEIKQQVTIGTTSKIFNCKIKLISFPFSVGLLRAH